MVRHFEEELKQLKSLLFHMGQVVESMIHNAIRSLVENKPDLNKQVLAWEDEVNRIQIEIDDLCITLLALQQPAAIDLRFITSAMKINSDLERMGDQAVNITEHSTDCMECMPADIAGDINKMSELVQDMVKKSLEAFLSHNVETAKAVMLLDDQVDDLKDHVFEAVQLCIKKDTNHINHSLDVMLVSRNLERIGDHTTNIAEDVIFMILGKDIRHHHQVI